MSAAFKAFAAFADETVVRDWAYAPRELQPEDVQIRIVASGVCVRCPPRPAAPHPQRH